MVKDLLRSKNAKSRTRSTCLSGMRILSWKQLLVNAKQTGHQVGGTGKGNEGCSCTYVGQRWRKRQEKPGKAS